TLHHFWYGDGSRPYAGLIQAADGNLYGTTAYGANGYGTTIYGLSGYGMVFRVALDGTFNIIHFFQLTDGASPRGDLLQGLDGNLYGTTSYGGPNGGGVVFRILLHPAATTTLSSSANPSWLGQTVELTATVTGRGGAAGPDGQVEFF